VTGGDRPWDPAAPGDLREPDAVELLLGESEDVFRTVFETSLASMTLRDADGRILLLNRRAREVVGPPSPVGRSFLEYTHPEDRPREERLFRELVAGERDSYEIEKRYLAAGGDVAWVRILAVAARDARGVFRFAAVTGENINERRAMEGALRESEERYRQLVEQAPEAILVHRDGRILYANAAAARLFGMASATLLEDALLLDLLHPDDRPVVREDLEEELDSSQPRRRIRRIRRLDGTGMVLEITVIPITYRGEPARQAMVRDITLQVENEAALRRSQQELRRLAGHLQRVREDEQERIGRELHDELGQALSGLKLDLTALRRHLARPTPPEATVEARLARMVSTVDGTLDLLKRICLELRPVVLDDLGLEAAAEWLVDDVGRRSGLDVRFAGRLGGADVGRERAGALYRILQEALTNVLRHAGARHVDVELGLENGDVVLTVRDDGRGFRHAEVARGTSLGLVGMRERALAVGGRVEVEGRRSRGTRVVARFPLGAPAAEAMP
jgi:two-component system sensor histidine kinase UhpB